MSKARYLTAHVIPGSLDSFEFFDFIVEDVACFHLPSTDTYLQLTVRI
jgi:hypothetical protein